VPPIRRFARKIHSPTAPSSAVDVFRAELPLMTILNPTLVNDQICSLLELARRSGRGYLERWEIMNAYSGCMDGDPALSVILDAYSKGIRNFDVEQAYADCRQSAAGTGTATGRPDNEFYMKNGYVPEQVSWTLDNAHFDWCVSRLAAALGNAEDAHLFADRAMNYRKIYDPEVRSMRARRRDGQWLEWKGNLEFGQGCTESNPLQQSWFVPHDVYGLISLMGKERFGSALEDMFRTYTSVLWVEPLLQSFQRAGSSRGLSVCLRRQAVAYAEMGATDSGAGLHAQLNGICGNDDVGQMSAWYILSAIGFYPVCPEVRFIFLGLRCSSVRPFGSIQSASRVFVRGAREE